MTFSEVHERQEALLVWNIPCACVRRKGRSGEAMPCPAHPIPRACTPAWQWLLIPGTPDARHSSLQPLIQLLKWPEVLHGGRPQESQQVFNPGHAARTCLDPTSSCNFYQLNTAGTRSGGCIYPFLCLSCLSLFLLLFPSYRNFE